MIKRFGWALAFGALVAVPGCKKEASRAETSTTTTTSTEPAGREAQAKQLEQAQERAADSYGKAAEAQNEAKDQQEDVAEAKEELAEKTEELGKAQAKVVEESAEAQASQQAAGQAAAQATQAAGETQKVSGSGSTDSVRTQAETQKVAGAEGAAAQPAAGTQTTSGTVREAHPDRIILDSEGKALTVKIDPSTAVMASGAQRSMKDLYAGSQVNVTYRMDGNQPMATRIDITP
jgi:hypothetical protein